MANAKSISPAGRIARAIFVLRGHRVLLDTELAALYKVATKAFNQAVKRNLKRFPADFLFRLTSDEMDALRSQIVTLKRGRGQHAKYPPYAFTEHGAIMVATILNSPRAVEYLCCARICENARVALVKQRTGPSIRAARNETRREAGQSR